MKNFVTVLQRHERLKARILERVKPGMEVNCGELAKELGVSRSKIFDMADGDLQDEGFHLHVADGCGGGVFERPKKLWTLYRDDETS